MVNAHSLDDAFIHTKYYISPKKVSYKKILKCKLISSCYRTVPSAIWEIFSEFHIFCNLFHEPLGE